MMGYGVSILFLAVGAVLTWAVDATVQGVNLDAVGIILMVVGAIGLLFSLLFLDSLMDRRRSGDVVQREVIERDAR